MIPTNAVYRGDLKRNGMTFRDHVWAHLSQYRENVLRLPLGTFSHRGRRIPKGHILPRKYFRHNLLEPYRNRFFSSDHGSIKLHKYFHHLNSSQALCINLLFPLLVEKREDLLARSFGLRLTPPLHARFESESPIEIAKRRTSFDFHLSAEGRDVYVEVKYTEDGFGAAEDDAEHRAKFVETYAPLLSKSPFLTASCRDCTFFLQNYQVLRNLVHITEGSEVVFLFPRENDSVAKEALEAREELLTGAGKGRLHILFLEDVVAQLIEGCGSGALRAYYQAFGEKYLAYVS